MRIIFLVCMLAGAFYSKACDNCNVFVGVNPNDFNHSVQLLYRWNERFGTFNSAGVLQKHGGEHLQYVSNTVKEYYATMEVRGTYFFHPRFSVMASLPVRNSYRSIDGVRTADVYGLGDPMLIGNYRLLNSKTIDSTRFQHRFELMGGAKFPLGKIDASWNDQQMDHDMQPGTGSLDWIIGGTYTVMYRKVGLLTRANWKLNGANRNNFKYGTSTNFESNLFVNKSVGAFELMPYAGCYYEGKGLDTYEGLTVVNSEVSILYGRVGMTTFWNKLSLRLDYLTPIHQVVEGQNLRQGQHFNASLSYYFN